MFDGRENAERGVEMMRGRGNRERWMSYLLKVRVQGPLIVLAGSRVASPSIEAIGLRLALACGTLGTP